MKLVYKPFAGKLIYRLSRDDRPPRFVPAHIETGERNTIDGMLSGKPNKPFREMRPDSLSIDDHTFTFRSGRCDRVRVIQEDDEAELREIEKQIAELQAQHNYLRERSFVRGKPITKEQIEQFAKVLV